MILFYLLVSVMPLARHRIWSESVGGVTVVKYLGALTCLYALYYLTRRPTFPRFFATPQACCFLLFASLVTWSYLVLGAPMPLGASPLTAQISFIQLFFITLVTVNSERRLRNLVLVIIGSVAFASLHALREWQTAGFSSGYRPGWVSGDPNYFSISALVGLPLALSLLVGQVRLSRWERGFLLGSVCVTVLALVAAASRGALIGLGTVLMLAAWRSRYRGKMLALAGFVVLPLLLLSPSAPLGRLLNPSHGDRESTDARLTTWTAALKMSVDHPVFGVGVGNFKTYVRQYGGTADESVGEFIAHNTYIQIAAEAGLPSLALFLLIQLGTVRTARRVQRMTFDAQPSLVYDSARGIELGVIGFTVTAFFLSAEQTKLFWLLVFLAMALPALAARARKQARDERNALPSLHKARTATAA